MSQKIYTGFSPYSYILMLILRIGALLAIILTAPHYNDNPVLIIIVLLILAAVVIFFGDDQVTVYNDKIVQSNNSIGDYIFKLKNRAYYIKDIKAAHLPTAPPPSSTGEIGVAVALAVILPGNRRRSRTSPSTKIILDMKDGRSVQLLTDLESGKVQKIIDTINHLKQQEKVITSPISHLCLFHA